MLIVCSLCWPGRVSWLLPLPLFAHIGIPSVCTHCNAIHIMYSPLIYTGFHIVFEIITRPFTILFFVFRPFTFRFWHTIKACGMIKRNREKRNESKACLSLPAPVSSLILRHLKVSFEPHTCKHQTMFAHKTQIMAMHIWIWLNVDFT